MSDKIKYRRKPRPVFCALFWIFATFSAISGTAWYYTLTGRLSIAINLPPQPQVQQAAYAQDMTSLMEEANREVKLTR